ncbi:MAG: hypothetical protein NTY90_01595 [Candidatus Micrarchaeota archaeon]|nr:hypothetical protein [Candidatus Micrarchaeota archaeon]
MARAQVFATDFAASIVIFFSAVLVVSLAWNGFLSESADASTRHAMLVSAHYAADALVQTQGVPAAWNESTAVAIGLADGERVLNLSKIISLRKMDYDEAKAMLRLGPYHFRLSITGKNGTLHSGIMRPKIALFAVEKTDLLPVVNSSGMPWDFYYGKEAPVPEGLTAGKAISGPKAGVFNMMLGNGSAYSFIVIEEPRLAQADVDAASLESFVRRGGTLLLEDGIGWDGELLVENYGMHAVGFGENHDGPVVSGGYFLSNVSPGELVSFGSSQWGLFQAAGDSPISMHVADSGNASLALAASWKHGFGTIYYLADASGSVGGTPLINSLNLVGEPLEYGLEGNPYDAAVVTRAVIVRGDWSVPANLGVVVWK